MCERLAQEGGQSITVSYEKPGVVSHSQARPGDCVISASELPWIDDLFGGLPPTALIADLRVSCPTTPTAISVQHADSVPGAVLQHAADQKLHEFGVKCGAAGRAAITLPHVWIFHPWIMDVYGGIHATFLEDLRGIAALLVRRRLGRRPHDDPRDKAAAAALLNVLLTLLSFTLQRQLFRFFEGALAPPAQ